LLIRVVYPDGKYDMVNGAALDRLIEKKAIRSFRRSSGWVLLGVDPVRNPKSQVEYAGEKRRSMDFAPTYQ